MLRPFNGYRSWDDAFEGRSHTLLAYDSDRSGTKTYAFNSLGFRGQEFDPNAEKHIFFCGCSYTFGVGLNLEETAAWKFKELYCAHQGLDPATVNLMNFAMPGASNDYITRTLISQCERVVPDVLVAVFSHADRAEHIDEETLGERVWTVAPWWIREAIPEEQSGPSRDSNSEYDTMREASLGYYHYSTPANALANFLRNVLLLQFYCESKRIPHTFHWVETERLKYIEQHFALGPLAAIVDRSRFPKWSAADDYWFDKAADGTHPGPASNARLAQALFETHLANHS